MPEIVTEVWLPGDRATLFDNVSRVKRDIEVLKTEDKHFQKSIDNAIQLAGRAIEDTKGVESTVNTLGMQYEALTGEIRSVRDGMEMGFTLIRKEMQPAATAVKQSWLQQQFSSWKNPVPVLTLLAVVAIVGREGISMLIEFIKKAS